MTAWNGAFLQKQFDWQFSSFKTNTKGKNSSSMEKRVLRQKSSVLIFIGFCSNQLPWTHHAFFHLALLWNCAALCAHKFQITDLTRLFNDKCLDFLNLLRGIEFWWMIFKFVVFCQQALMLHIENRLINHRRHGQALLFTQTMGDQEIRIPTVRSVLRPRKKLRHGGELIFWRHKPFESSE